jgi:hypothetical protein
MSCAKNTSGFGNNPQYAEYIDFIQNKRLYNSIHCKKNKGFKIVASFARCIFKLFVLTVISDQINDENLYNPITVTYETEIF